MSYPFGPSFAATRDRVARMPFDFSFSTEAPVAGAATLQATKTTVYVGEPTQISWADLGMPNPDPRRLQAFYDFDDPGKAYGVGTGYSASVSYMPVTAKSWDTPGVKTVQGNFWNSNGEETTGTIQITVLDLSTFDEVAYVSWVGDTTGFPAATGNVVHVTSKAQWDALNYQTANQKKAAFFRDDETFTFTSESTKVCQGANSTYIFGATKGGTLRPLITSATELTYFEGDRSFDGISVTVRDFRFAGSYDPQTGIGAHVTAFSGAQASGAQTSQTAVCECDMDGGAIARMKGVDSTFGRNNHHLLGNRCRNWREYAAGRFGGLGYQVAIGNDWQQNPLANIFLSTKDTSPDMADHTFRFGCTVIAAVEGNTSYTAGGWSNLADEWAENPACRIHPTNHTLPWEVYVAYNDFKCAWLPLQIGDVTSGDEIDVKGLSIVYGNKLTSGRQVRHCLQIDAGNAGIFNNLMYNPNLDNSFKGFNGAIALDASLTGSTSTGSTAYIGFNHMISHREDEFRPIDNSWVSSTVTDEHNIVHAPNAATITGGFSNDAQVSQGDWFKILTANPGHNAVTTGWKPRWDIDKNLRGSTTSKGCYHGGVASAQAVSPPVNTVAPAQPAELSAFPDVWYVPDHGTWTGLDSPYERDFFWTVGGAEPTKNAGDPVGHRTVLDNSALAGDTAGRYTGQSAICAMTFTNRSGQKVTVNTPARTIT